MPQQITHPFDHQNHVLSLHTKPVYTEGLFNCDACGLQGDGFCYHCKVCGIDLHILCASSPLNFNHQYHHHQLQLTFSPPYPGNIFSCDMCGMNGCNIWLYRCDMCQFDAHLTCVNKHFPHLFPQNSMPNNFRGSVNSQPHLFSQHSMPNNFASRVQHPQVIGTPFVRAPVQNYGVVPTMNNVSNSGAFRPARPAGNGLMNQLVGGVANGIASGASQAIAGALIQGLIGGGDGGNSGGGTDVGIDLGYGGGMDGGDPNSASNY